MSDWFAWFGGVRNAEYLLSGVIAAVLMVAIVPWTTGGRAAWRRFAEWLVVTALVYGVVEVILSVYGSISSATRGAGYARSEPGAVEPGEMAVMGSTVVYVVVMMGVGYLLAALLYRRMRWAVLEQRTGWRLDGWRRWPVFLLAGPFFMWPFSVLLVAVSGAWTLAYAASAALTRDLLFGLLTVVAVLGAVLVAAVVAWSLRTPDLELAEAVTDGSSGARRLCWIGGVGVLAVGLQSVVTALAQFAYGDSASATGLRPVWSVPWYDWLALAVTLGALVLLTRPWWRDRLEDVTGRIWSSTAQALAALTLGSWFAWPVPIVGGLLADLATFSVDPQYALWAAWLVFAVAVAMLLRIRRAEHASSDDQ